MRCRPSTLAFVAWLASLLGGSTARAGGFVAHRPASIESLRRTLIEGGAQIVAADKLYYHQLRAEHRALWRDRYRQQGRAVLPRLIVAGRYPGIWLAEDPLGWPGYRETRPRPIGVKVKAGLLFVDLEWPRQHDVLVAWRARADAGPAVVARPDLFQQLEGPDGVSLATRAAFVHGPPEAGFYEELGVAGVIAADAWHIPCPVLLHPEAIEDLIFD